MIETASFLYRTRLPIFVLVHIWEAVARNRAHIVAGEFFILMRLVRTFI